MVKPKLTYLPYYVLPALFLSLVGSMLHASSRNGVYDNRPVNESQRFNENTRHLPVPAWEVFARELKATLGRESCVKVSNLTRKLPHGYLLEIKVSCGAKRSISNAAKAQALATLMSDTYKFSLEVASGANEDEGFVLLDGGHDVEVVVHDAQGVVVKKETFPSDPADAAQLFIDALASNPLFVQTLPGGRTSDLALIFAKEVVQFKAGDPGDFFANRNMSAEASMAGVLRLATRPLRIGTGTKEDRAQQSNHELSPPQWVFWSRLQGVIGGDACVRVFKPQAAFEASASVGAAEYGLDIQVVCDDARKTQALATLLTGSFTLSNQQWQWIGLDGEEGQELTTVQVQVKNAAGQVIAPQAFPRKPKDAKRLFTTALQGNRYFVAVVSSPPRSSGAAPQPALSLIFTKSLVQYYCDDISHSYGNRNVVAARAFRKVLNLGQRPLPVGIGTSPSAAGSLWRGPVLHDEDRADTGQLRGPWADVAGVAALVKRLGE